MNYPCTKYAFNCIEQKHFFTQTHLKMLLVMQCVWIKHCLIFQWIIYQIKHAYTYLFQGVSG